MSILILVYHYYYYYKTLESHWVKSTCQQLKEDDAGEKATLSIYMSPTEHKIFHYLDFLKIWYFIYNF